MKEPDADLILEGRRVLVVEDELLVAMDVDSVLRAAGCEVIGPATTPESAIALIERGQPEAALLDLNLGGKSALPVAATLRARGVPFLIVSGYGERHSRAPELEGAPRLSKPVSHRQLIDALRQLFMSWQPS